MVNQGPNDVQGTPRAGLFGVSAVGKTTLFRELVERRDSGDKWISADEAVAGIAGTNRAPAFPAGWSLALDYCHRLFTEYRESFDDKSIRFVLMHVLRTARIDAARLPSVVAFGEDVTLRYLSMAMRHPLGERFAFEFLDLVPAPAGIVHLVEEPERVVERSLARPKMLSVYAGLDKEALFDRIVWAQESVRRAAARLADRGTRVLVLDSGTTLDSKINESRAFLRKLEREDKATRPGTGTE